MIRVSDCEFNRLVTRQALTTQPALSKQILGFGVQTIEAPVYPSGKSKIVASKIE